MRLQVDKEGASGMGPQVGSGFNLSFIASLFTAAINSVPVPDHAPRCRANHAANAWSNPSTDSSRMGALEWSCGRVWGFVIPLTKSQLKSRHAGS